MTVAFLEDGRVIHPFGIPGIRFVPLLPILKDRVTKRGKREVWYNRFEIEKTISPDEG